MGFAADLAKYVDKAKLRAETVVRKTAFELQASVVALSPVAEQNGGRFRANWMVGTGGIDKKTVSVTDKTGELSLARVENVLGTWLPGTTIYLTNSLPYALTLEYGLYGNPPGSANGPKTSGGYSKQAVGGMVRLTVQNFREHVRKAVKDSK